MFGWEGGDKKKIWWCSGVFSSSPLKCFFTKMERKLRKRVIWYMDKNALNCFLGQCWLFYFILFIFCFLGTLCLFFFFGVGWQWLDLICFLFFGFFLVKLDVIFFFLKLLLFFNKFGWFFFSFVCQIFVLIGHHFLISVCE